MRSLTLSSLFISCALAQQVSGPKSNLTSQAGGLKVIAIQGEGAINNLRSNTATQPVVEVRDEADKPVAGAEVVFQLPAAGPGGVFNGWMRTQTARTDAQGRAAASGLTPNDEEGRFNIKVTATSGNKTGGLVIGQSNARNGGTGGPKLKSRSGTWWKLLALAGAGAIAGGVYAATRGDNSSTAPVTNPVTITPGTITIGGPR